VTYLQELCIVGHTYRGARNPNIREKRCQLCAYFGVPSSITAFICVGFCITYVNRVCEVDFLPIITTNELLMGSCKYRFYWKEEIKVMEIFFLHWHVKSKETTN
jgi:ferredoxin